jgi:general secretion pathway protein D
MSRRSELRRLALLPFVFAPVGRVPALAQQSDDKAKQEALEKALAEQEGASDKERAAAAAARANRPDPQQPAQPARPGAAPGQPGPGNQAGQNPSGKQTGNPRPGVQGPVTLPTQPNRSTGNAGTSGGSGGGVQGGPPSIQEQGDYYILNFDETDAPITLEWLTKMCQLATGKNFNYDAATVGAQLAQTGVRMFGEKRIPKSEFYEFYQILMFIHGYSITKVGPDHLAVYLIQSSLPGKAPQGSLKEDAIYVEPGDLDRFADQVATQIMSVLHLPNTDVRTLGNSLRGLTGNDQTSTIMPVANTNSVVLRGYAPNVVAIARILSLVDELAGRDTGVVPLFEVVPLEFAAAEDLADILEQLLEARKREAQQQRQTNAQGATGQIPTAGGETKILTYPRTNSLLVMALPDDMQAIKELIARLDVEVVEPERTYHVYLLEHVKAEDLSEVLEDFIQGASRVQSGQGAQARGGAAAPAAQGLTSRDNEVVVVPDPATNSLLIAASRRRYEEVLNLIHQLDRRQQQVLIETALIELTSTDGLDLGVELGGADLPGTGTGSFGITSFGLSTFEDTDSDGVFDTRVPRDDFLGITAGILKGDDFNLPALLVAIRNRQDTNVLNIPSVLVNDNGSATVKTLDEQPTTQVTANGVGGQTQENFNDYQKAGITMEISPSISASGYLRLQVSLEVSNFTGTFQGAIPPPRITRTLNTSVSVPNGDTMVIGGIIVDNKGHQRQSVPWLGDIPLLGALFRRDTDNQNRTTLYFFVTPHILKDENFADLAEISHRVKQDAAEKIGLDRVRVVDPRHAVTDGPIDLGSFDVPLYRRATGGETSGAMVGKDPTQATEPPKND